MDENTPKKPDMFEFSDTMTRGERIAAWIYLPVHVVGIPLLMSLIFILFPDAGLTDAKMNALYYGFGALYIFLFLWKYLRGGYDTLIDNIRRCLVALLMGWLLHIIMSFSLSIIMTLFGMDLASSPNNDAVVDMAKSSYGSIFAMAVFLAPIVEEPLFRGAVFGSIRPYNRAAAYAVSSVLFSLYHVWQFAVLYQDPRYLLSAVSYLPISIALCYSYERSGSIWVPVLFHMSMNLLSMVVFTAL